MDKSFFTMIFHKTLKHMGFNNNCFTCFKPRSADFLYIGHMVPIGISLVHSTFSFLENVLCLCEGPRWQARGVTGGFSKGGFYLINNNLQNIQ